MGFADAYRDVPMRHVLHIGSTPLILSSFNFQKNGRGDSLPCHGLITYKLAG